MGSAAAPGLVARSARNLTRGTTLATDVEVASSIWARFWGLMGRPVLLPGHGMWLPSDNGIHMFFMRFAIDAVFLGKPAGSAPGARPIVGLRRGLRPWIGIVPLVRGADGVLELPVGTIDASGSELGDLVSVG